MRIDSISSPLTSSDTPQPPPTSPAVVGTSDEFLRLFIAQLENQNPLDPQDGADFVAQLAQFSAVEQSAETNKRLGAILASQQSVSNAALAGFVGKTGTVAGDRFTISGRTEGIPALGLELGTPASKVEVIIRDNNGNQVKRFDLGAQTTGRITVPWDGKTDSGTPLAKGDYEIEVTASAADGSAVQASTTLSGLIQAIDFIDGAPRLRIGAVSAAPSDVLSIE
jgi:flagellar basal-body rod modification protein FlgD